MIPKWVVNLVDSFRGLMRFPPVVIDGVLYVAIAALTFMQTVFGGDEAVQYIPGKTLFWVKLSVGTLGAAALALKMFRSTSYSDHLKPKDGTGDTQFFEKPPTETKP